MKEWFKYEFGYVNIDSENLYLTNSGNWSETKELTEKTKQVAKKNDNQSSLMIGSVLVVLGILGFLLFKNLVSGKVGLTLIVLVLGGGYKFYEYMKTEIGAKFMIPLHKISEIGENGNGMEIIFTTGEGAKDSYKLHGMDEKGKKIMDTLKRQYDGRTLMQN